MFDLTKYIPPFFKSDPLVGLLLGEASSGKTTLLYHLLLSAPPSHTIPTMGFNIETLPALSPLPSTTLWDMGGGCGRQRALFRLYYKPERFAIFLHDGTASGEWEKESFEGLQGVLGDMEVEGCRGVWVVVNKQDEMGRGEERRRRVAGVEEGLRGVVRPFLERGRVTVTVWGFEGFSARTGEGIRELMRAVGKRLKKERRIKREKGEEETSKEEAVVGFVMPSGKEVKVMAREMAERTVDIGVFWNKFETGTLEVWDHAAHLRAGFTICMRNPEANVSGVTDEFVKRLQALHAARPEVFRNTVHQTMTKFWMHMIFRATTVFRIMNQEVPNASFEQVLGASPHLANKHLWRDYYSQAIMMSLAAKEARVEPDIRGLPEVPRVVLDTDKNDAIRIVQFAFLVAKALAVTKGEEGGRVVDVARGVWREVLGTKTSSSQLDFWIRFCLGCLRVLDGKIKEEKENTENIKIKWVPAIQVAWSGPVRAMSFLVFQVVFGIVGNEWGAFMSRTEWEGLEGGPRAVTGALEDGNGGFLGGDGVVLRGGHELEEETLFLDRLSKGQRQESSRF